MDWEEEKIRCRICGTTVTTESERMRMNGSHEHAFVNPLGLLFRIGCFSGARGCLAAGEPTGDYTWFPGYTWRFAVCSNCRVHLGWCYQSGTGAFWGLILDRLVSG
ncbi:MAG: hypothetical protein E4G96_08000 [Chrysiogenales bacterium]|nr:MAG: hypothetical protein E4G96_08000 [Chrysiogenales bacterium]